MIRGPCLEYSIAKASVGDGGGGGGDLVGVMGAFWNVPTVDPLLWVSRKEIASSTGIPTYLVEVRRKKYRVRPY